MLLTLETHGLIERTPGQSRCSRVLGVFNLAHSLAGGILIFIAGLMRGQTVMSVGGDGDTSDRTDHADGDFAISNQLRDVGQGPGNDCGVIQPLSPVYFQVRVCTEASGKTTSAALPASCR
jgi:hypothetical protein